MTSAWINIPQKGTFLETAPSRDDIMIMNFTVVSELCEICLTKCSGKIALFWGNDYIPCNLVSQSGGTFLLSTYMSVFWI